MLSVDEIKKSLSEINGKIERFFSDFVTQIHDKIVNEQESRNLYFELETVVNGFLQEIFGEEGDTKSNALSSGFLHYNSRENINSDAVIFNYWSHKGESIETPIRVVTGQWRDNLYYKGYRWSDKEKKTPFYRFFNKLKSSLQGEAPVDFFTKHGVENDTRYLKILNLPISNNRDISKIRENSKKNQISIPILSNTDKIIKSNAFKKLIKLVFSMREVNENTQQFDNFYDNKKTDIETLDDLVTKAYSEAERLDKDLLDAVREALIECLTSDKVKKSKLNDVIRLRDAFNVVVAYQYYDHPYDIHIFLPASNHGNLYSCLVITVEQASMDITPYLSSFTELANNLGQITAIERTIWKQMKDNLPIYWRWKKHYEDFSDQHKRLSNVAMNICLAICKKEKVAVFSLPSRLKEFDSFYNKIVNRANGGDQDYPEKTSEISNNEWINIREDELKNYRDKILDPTWRNAEVILGNMKDVVGLRIICLYPAEKDKIINQFEHHQDKLQIAHFEKKDYPDPMGYRSTHIFFALGNKRCELYELEDLRYRKCEIQIRTILEQGWADVSHKAIYKPGVPKLLVEKIMAQIKDDLGDQAAALLNVDHAFDRIAQSVKKICEPET